MNRKEILSLLNMGENCEIEFKEARNYLPKSVWSSYSALANTNGGIIILGIAEKGKEKYEIMGIDNPSYILKDFWNTINNKDKVSINLLKDDDVKIEKINDKSLIIIKIHNIDRTLKPVFINKNPFMGTFKRNYEGDYRCTENEVKTMITESAINTKDIMIVDEFSIQDINKETLENYRCRFRVHKGENHEWNKLSDNEFLKMIGAIDRKSNNLTVAGLLIFGNEEDIVKITTNYFLDYREILSTDLKERWSHRITSWDESWSGNLFDFYNKIVNRLTSDIEIPFKLDKDMTRIEDTEIHKCVREALVNTLVHAQFFESGSIVIEKGINYFKFANPGDMRVPFIRAKLGGESDPRNRLIHKIFSLVGLGERAGSGIYKITNEWDEKGWIEPNIEQLSNPDRTILKLTMKKKEPINVVEDVVENVVENVVEKLTMQEMKLLNTIMKDNNLTQSQMAEKLKISTRQVSRRLRELKVKGVIERIGSDKKGYWKIVKMS